MDPLTKLLYQLQDGRQRASYGAAADLLNAVPMFLMRGRPRDPLHSWIVNASTGLPTGYSDDDAHSELLANDRVLISGDELRTWLDEQA